jgi:hypothetical protein
VAEFMRQLQTVILTAATTIDVWRDGAIAILALVAIAGVRVFVEASGS